MFLFLAAVDTMMQRNRFVRPAGVKIMGTMVIRRATQTLHLILCMYGRHRVSAFFEQICGGVPLCMLRLHLKP